jgi:hypothetical protein
MTKIEWTFESGSRTMDGETSLISDIAGVPECAGMSLEGRRSSAARLLGQRGCDGLDFVDQHVEILFSCSVVRDAGP